MVDNMPTTAPVSRPQLQALRRLPVEFGSYGAPHPNVLNALIRRGLARQDHSAHDGFGDCPAQVVLTVDGKTLLRQHPAPKVARTCYYIPSDGYVEGEGWRVAIVIEGQPGYRPTGDWPCSAAAVRPYFFGHDYQRAQFRVDDVNEWSGLSEADVAAIVLSSMG